jgi:hypothetical protein
MRSKFSTLIPLVVALCAAVGCDKKDNTIKIGQAVALTGARYLAFRTVPGLLPARCFPPCAVLGSLLSVRSVLSTFCLGVCVGLLLARRRAPRTGRELLRARHLAFRIALGLLLARRFPPRAARGSLRWCIA